MSIDERLDRLVERHEALTEGVELMRREEEERNRKWDARWSQIATALEQDGENIRALAHVAEIHERRLTSLEGGQE